MQALQPPKKTLMGFVPKSRSPFLGGKALVAPTETSGSSSSIPYGHTRNNLAPRLGQLPQGIHPRRVFPSGGGRGNKAPFLVSDPGKLRGRHMKKIKATDQVSITPEAQFPSLGRNHRARRLL